MDFHKLIVYLCDLFVLLIHDLSECLQVTSPQLSDIDMGRLKGYHTACQTLRSVPTPQEKAKESLYQLAEQARQNDYQVVLNFTNQLTSLFLFFRSNLEFIDVCIYMYWIL